MDKRDVSSAGPAVLHPASGAQGDGVSAASSMAATWDRVALALSAAEAHGRDDWQRRFRDILEGYQFLPSGRTLRAAGAHSLESPCDCVGIAPLVNSLDGVFDALRNSALSLHAGMDVALDLSNLQPAQATPSASGLGGIGPAPMVRLWNVVAGIVEAGGSGQGVVSASLRCDHPDIAHYIEAIGHDDLGPRVSRSVFVSDAFMDAVSADAEWPLVFPLCGQAVPQGAAVCERVWPGNREPQPCLVHQRIKARSLWVRLLQSQHCFGSLRLVFSDAIQQGNNLWFGEQIHMANPTGSVPLTDHASCVLGAINLSCFVRMPFEAHPEIDWQRLRYTAATAVRFLDNVYDLAPDAHHQLARGALASRRLGLGMTGLASMFAMLGLRYGSEGSLELAGKLMQTIKETAYQMSCDIAREKGSFPAYDSIRYAASPTVLDLPHALQDAIARQGMRNSHLLAVGPHDALYASHDAISPGTEPLRTLPPGGSAHAVLAGEVAVEQQLDMACAVQAQVDNAVAVNVYVPRTTPSVQYDGILRGAWKRRLKNCLVIRLPD